MRTSVQLWLLQSTAESGYEVPASLRRTIILNGFSLGSNLASKHRRKEGECVRQKPR